MSFRQSGRNLDADIDYIGWSKRIVFDCFRERAAFNVLHHDEGRVTFFADFMDCADIWMIERCRRLRFSKEPFLCLLVADRSRWQHFDCYFAIELDVLRKVHLAHTTRTELPNDSVVRNLF